jgi:hypothetical protein
MAAMRWKPGGEMAAQKKSSKGTGKKQSSQGKSLPKTGWQQLTESFPDHPALESETIYALPTELLAAIDVEVSGFFSEEDRQFEQALTRLGGHGFFLQEPFGFTLLDKQKSLAVEDQSGEAIDPEKEEERWEKTDKKLRDMLTEMMTSDGRTKEEIKRYFAQGPEFEKRMRVKRDGYAGWLVTDPRFRSERDEFCQLWRDHILQFGTLPTVPISLMGEAPPKLPKRERRFYSDYMSFYRRWGLESLATWQLPVPMRAEFLGFSHYDLKSVREAGVNVFVPYHLLRDRSLTLYDVAEHRQLLQPTDHLQDWFGVQSNNWGPDRYAVMYQLYVFLELALRRRYGDRLRGKTMMLDQAFARCQEGLHADSRDVDATAESVKKIRLNMQKRLRQYEPHC